MVLKGYKGFDKGLVCRGKQYAENTVFEEEEAFVCRKGMHFCTNPFDVLDYYNLVNSDGTFNDFAEVEALAETKTNDDKKFCTTKLKIGSKLSFSGFIKACVDFTIEKTKNTEEFTTNNDNGKTKTQIGSSRDYAQIGSSGCFARVGSYGCFAQIGSSGDSAQIGSSGGSARVGSSGDYAQIGSSGDYAQIGSSGCFARVGSYGDSAQIGSAGDSARIYSAGQHSVICCAGHKSIVRAKKGSWITLSEWEYSEENRRYAPVCVKTEFVDGERIKEDVFYKLENGLFVEV